MKRSDFLNDEDVQGFVEWVSDLMSRKRGLVSHAYKTRGREFRFTTLYEAFEKYYWPNPFGGPSFDDAAKMFEDYRRQFDQIGCIRTPEDRRQFFSVAESIAKWGGINNLRIASGRNWGSLQPRDLQNHVDEIKNKLDPADPDSDIDKLPASLRMSSGYSKIYAALIPGLPIYDSRVACALTCLIRLYERKAGSNVSGDKLSFPVPAHRGSRRCTRPAIRYGQDRKYAEANLKCAWLLVKLVEQPGDFAQVSESRRVDALQSALFMLGYARLRDNAIVKTC